MPRDWNAITPENLAQRFWSKVEIRGDDDCWPFTGHISPSGYGHLTRAYGDTYAHRIAYRLAVGDIPKGKFVCHHCDHRPCCNPKHLFIGTAAENNRDMCRKKRYRGMYGRLGEANPQTPLTADDVRRIRDGFVSGTVSRRELGRRYGVSHSTICSILKRKTWAHIE